MRDNETYSEAKCQFSVRNRDVLMNDNISRTTTTTSRHKWWSTLKSELFGWSSSQGSTLLYFYIHIVLYLLDINLIGIQFVVQLNI